MTALPALPVRDTWVTIGNRIQLQYKALPNLPFLPRPFGSTQVNSASRRCRASQPFFLSTPYKGREGREGRARLCPSRTYRRPTFGAALHRGRQGRAHGTVADYYSGRRSTLINVDFEWRGFAAIGRRVTLTNVDFAKNACASLNGAHPVEALEVASL